MSRFHQRSRVGLETAYVNSSPGIYEQFLDAYAPVPQPAPLSYPSQYPYPAAFQYPPQQAGDFFLALRLAGSTDQTLVRAALTRIAGERAGKGAIVIAQPLVKQAAEKGAESGSMVPGRGCSLRPPIASA